MPWTSRTLSLTVIGLALTLASASPPVSAQARMAAWASVRVPADGSAVSLKTPLDEGGWFLLKASGSVKAGADTVDAEYGGFGPRTAGRDVVGGTDVGVDVGIPSRDSRVPAGDTPGRKHWFGGYRPDHTYLMLVNGAGQPLTLRLLTGGGKAGSGAVTVSVFRLSPDALPSPWETLQVPVLERVVSTSLSTRPSVVYLLQASGSGHVGGGGLGQGDAEYMDYQADGTGTVDIGDAHTDYGLGVDEADQSRSPRLRKWGPWRSDHTYYMLFAGTGHPVRFFFYDVKGGYGDNSPTDALTVRVFPVP